MKEHMAYPFGEEEQVKKSAFTKNSKAMDRHGRPAMNSLTSPEFAHARVVWPRVQKALKKMYWHPSYTPNLVSPHVPFNFGDYVQHLSEWKRQLESAEARRAARQAVDVAARDPDIPALEPHNFGAFYWAANPSNLGTVLCHQTIWCRDPFVSWGYFAEWPVAGELELEGNARIKTENHIYGRFLPLPRLPRGHPQYDPDYTKCPVLPAREFDRTWPAPDYESILAPVDEIDDDVVPTLLNAELIKELDDGVYP
jgi:hypothetical protein